MSALFRRPLTPKAGNRPRAIPFRSDVGQLQRDLVGYSLELFCQFILRAGCGAENFLCRSVLRMSRLPRRPSGLLTERCRSVDQLLESELQAGIGLELTRFGGHLRVPTGGFEYGQVQVKMG